jgi:hypothetical protein
VAALKFLFQNDLTSWSQRAGEDEKMQKLATRAKAIAGLAASNPDKFRKEYALLKCTELGGPDTWEGVMVASGQASVAQADRKKMEQQQAYNQHNLKAELKQRLQSFVSLARTVDFSAQTRMAGARKVFVNPSYESKSSNWKMLYRLGPEATRAAMEEAEAWLRTL